MVCFHCGDNQENTASLYTALRKESQNLGGVPIVSLVISLAESLANMLVLPTLLLEEMMDASRVLTSLAVAESVFVQEYYYYG